MDEKNSPVITDPCSVSRIDVISSSYIDPEDDEYPLVLRDDSESSEVGNDDNSRRDTVMQHYRDMRSFQTFERATQLRERYGKFDNMKMSVWDALERLGDYVDSSDPDGDLTVLEHSLQTAEGIRAGGHPEWFQLIGLIHDLGKIQFLWGRPEDGLDGTAEGKQWALGGDTWVVGCKLPTSLIFPELNSLSSDMADPVMGMDLGVYEPHCGLDKVVLPWGHDEYMYRMVLHNSINNSLPAEALAMLRYHSMYCWHQFGEYEHLMNEEDHELIFFVQEFNRFDLYSKSIARPNVESLKPYYQRLIDKYMPGVLEW